MESNLRFIQYTLFIALIFCLNQCKESSKSEQEQTTKQPGETKASFVGRSECVECHEREYKLWQGSHHDLAMQEVNEQNVLGNFNDARLLHYGIESRFFKRDNQYFVSTEGPDGKMSDYKIKYTFGFSPLQQYLVEFPQGKLQVLPLCWDTRPKKDGGQRWFHVYQNERIPPDDMLFWTKAAQNWNHMCAECHSTNVRKKYNFDLDTYETTWSEIDVSCEACHGPGSKHVIWAKAAAEGEKVQDDGTLGLMLRFKDNSKGTWVFNMETGNAERTTPLESDILVESCARCHARRMTIEENYIYGKPFMNTHLPSLLEENLYYADGQIYEEVYVYASFLQSKMYQKGVLCMDCHEPHSMKVYVQGNGLCYRCHLHDKFGSKTHHFHNPDSSGASCVECHMPERTYMVNDPRRDHSIRIPRPDLSLTLNTPNACNKCHSDKSTKWAADNFEEWFGSKISTDLHYGEILHAGRNGYPNAQKDLIKLINDKANPNIIRASALSLLGRYLTQQSLAVISKSLTNKDPLIRYAALRALEMLPPDNRSGYIPDFLSDPVRAVRIEAARLLADVPAQRLGRTGASLLERGIEEYIHVQMANGDQPASHLNLGVLHLKRGHLAKAETAYETAILIEPGIEFSYINLADLYRVRKMEDKSEEVLRQGLEILPNGAYLHYSMGLLLIRKKNTVAAKESLKKAVELQPENPNFSYTYSIALNSFGKNEEAIEVLEKALEFNPFDQNLLYTISTIERDYGNQDSAIEYARKLLQYYPENMNFRQLMQQLQAAKQTDM